MTLNGVIALILRFSPNSIALLANYVTIVEDKPIILSAENHDPWADPWAIYCLPVPVTLLAITNPPCSAVSLR